MDADGRALDGGAAFFPVEACRRLPYTSFSVGCGEGTSRSRKGRLGPPLAPDECRRTRSCPVDGAAYSSSCPVLRWRRFSIGPWTPVQAAPVLLCKPVVEVVFCLDTTGSMSGLLDGARLAIRN